MDALMEQMGRVLGSFSESVTRESSVVEPVFYILSSGNAWCVVLATTSLIHWDHWKFHTPLLTHNVTERVFLIGDRTETIPASVSSHSSILLTTCSRTHLHTNVRGKLWSCFPSYWKNFFVFFTVTCSSSEMSCLCAWLHRSPWRLEQWVEVGLKGTGCSKLSILRAKQKISHADTHSFRIM